MFAFLPFFQNGTKPKLDSDVSLYCVAEDERCNRFTYVIKCSFNCFYAELTGNTLL